MINTTKIAKSNLKNNKSKGILIIVTIILATTLLLALGMTCVDWNAYNKQRVIEYSGTQHGIYAGIDEDKYEEIKIHANIDETGIVNGIGVKSYKDESKIGISYVDENAMKYSNVKLIKGSIPVKENEIILEDLALEKLGYDAKVGQKIKIEFEDFSDGEIVNKEFVLTGIMKANEQAKIKKSYMGVVSKEYMTLTRDMAKENYNVFVTIKDASIFYLSIIIKVQEFGKLRALGATKKQIKSIVLKEGVILSSIAIPIGVLLGYIINKTIFGPMMASDQQISKLPICIGVIIISLITVLVSLLKPMKEASKVSIVEAVRYNGQDKSKKKTRTGYEEINLNRLSLANLTRNKKRTYVTILSLSLSGIIFVVMSSVMGIIDINKMARMHYPYDIELTLDGYTFGEEDSPNTEMNILQTKNPLGKEFGKQILRNKA
ncbi:MAG: FtsX-like permease family protein [Terrisporobacter sp.]